MEIERQQTDILILGSGGAGLFAALHAYRAAPELEITVAVKGLLGKSGCTRMVQGGYNAVLQDGDSLERHFMDTIRGGYWIPDQDLAWQLIETAPQRVLELENEIGCFFDRNPDGSLHGKAFAGQTFDRTIHKGDLTGIEIINRLSEQVWARPIRRLEEHRAVALLPSSDGARIAAVLFIDIRTGQYRLVQAKAVLSGTGGGPTMYRYHTPSGEKACDGLAMALRAGLSLRDMEMVQFHPTGLLAGPDTRLTGTVLEEGLRGSGGYLLNDAEERFMVGQDDRAERATRDIISRSIYREIEAGRGTGKGGVYIDMRHLDGAMVRRQFKGMVERCADVGADLVDGLVEVVPTAHYMMGGIEIGMRGETTLPGLYAAGEDTGGVHGANRLGGNGVANSTVYGGIAGAAMAAAVSRDTAFAEPDAAALDAAIAACEKPFASPATNLNDIRLSLLDLMWREAGIIRDGDSLTRASEGLTALAREHAAAGLAADQRVFNLTWHDWLNLDSQIVTSQAIVAAAKKRDNSRGAHYRTDYPDAGDLDTTYFTRITQSNGVNEVTTAPVRFTRVRPGESILENDELLGP